jgi:hypothetical protein
MMLSDCSSRLQGELFSDYLHTTYTGCAISPTTLFEMDVALLLVIRLHVLGHSASTGVYKKPTTNQMSFKTSILSVPT